MATLPIARVAALLALIANVLFNAFYAELGLEDMRTVSDRFHHLLTPAPFTFAIWGVIYTALGLYAVYALLPSQRSAVVHDAIAKAMVAWNVLAIGWITVFGSSAPVLALPIIVVMLGLAAYAYACAARATQPTATVPWLLAPFALLTTWMSVATVENVVMCVRAAGISGSDVGWASALLITMVVIGATLALRWREPWSAAVVAWACVGIAAEVDGSSATLHALAIGASIVTAALALFVVARPLVARTLARPA